MWTGILGSAVVNINRKDGVQEKGKAEGKQLEKIGVQEVRMPARRDRAAHQPSNPFEAPERDDRLSLMQNCQLLPHQIVKGA